MGDEAREGVASAAQPEAAPQPPLAKRRRGSDEDLRRVAEIVMVLSAMVEMRGGKEPTAAERALSAEARARLARACEGVRPKDLFSSEAVRGVVEDLGLNRSKDPALAFRSPKVSIAERLHHTKKKMEESRDYTSLAHASQPHSMSFGSNSESVGSQRFIAGKSSPMALPAGGFPNNSSGVHISALASSLPSMKHKPTSEAHSPLVKSSFGTDSPLVVTSSVEAVNQRLDARINGPTYFTLVRPTAANYLLEKTSASGTSTSAALTVQSQASSLQVNHAAKVLHGSHQVVKTHDTACPAVQTAQVNIAIGNQPSQGLTFVPVTSFANNHNEIAKSVMSVVQRKLPDCANLPLPSTDYIQSPLNCQVCKTLITDVESLLVCDACENGTHLKCLQPHGAKAIPKADWHCQKCLSASNGKVFPPKYGRVTRHFSTVKPTSCGGGTVMIEKNWEIPELKFKPQKSLESEKLSSSGVPQESSLDIRNKAEETTSTLKKPNEEQHSGLLENHLEENNGLESAAPASQIGVTVCQTARIKLETERLEPFSDFQSMTSDKQPEKDGLSISEMQTSISESMPDIKAQSEYLDSNKKQGTAVEIACQSHLPRDINVIKEANVLNTVDSTGNLTEKTSIPVIVDFKDTLKSSEVSASEVLEAKLEGEHGSQMFHDQVLGNGVDAANRGNHSAESLHTFHWIGDILEVLDGRTYYKSCRINGYIIKLNDNVIVSTDNEHFYPAKLLSLWEDNQVWSNLAIVNEYYFPGNLPDGVRQPSTPVKDEVYASDRRNTILASSICRPCNILPEEKYQEEAVRRSLLTDKADGLHSIFMCKWMFDRENGIFQSPAEIL